MPKDLKKALKEVEEKTEESLLLLAKVESLVETVLWWVNQKKYSYHH